ncbi:MAG: D-2-hydroxyacid dehydrogenase family protein, partial [Burkholderiaceae bacterium]|nr:D-2-hydroxyacid dehydrogenase family protein [Burkholderiaceae bacterium]
MKIAILDDYQDVVRHCQCFAMLKDHEVKVFNSSAVGIGQLAIRLAPFDALVLIRERTRFPRALLQRLPNLKLISQTGKVAGHIDLTAAREKNIAIAEGVGDATAPAELTWALIMAASRRLTNYASLLQQGTWQASSVQPAQNRLGRVLKQRRLGIWGYGKIGKRIASYATAFGMHVTVWGSEASRAQAVQDGYQAAASREAFFADSDIVTLHLRLNDATRAIVQ